MKLILHCKDQFIEVDTTMPIRLQGEDGSAFDFHGSLLLLALQGSEAVLDPSISALVQLLKEAFPHLTGKMALLKKGAELRKNLLELPNSGSEVSEDALKIAKAKIDLYERLFEMNDKLLLTIEHLAEKPDTSADPDQIQEKGAAQTILRTKSLLHHEDGQKPTAH